MRRTSGFARTHARGLVARASKWLLGEGIRILLYHHFPESSRASLQAHCELLAARYSPISLAQAVNKIERGDPVPRNAVVVTIDDGYADYLHVAHACFFHYGIPTTVFVTEELIDGQWLWFDRLEYSLKNSTRSQLLIDTGSWREKLQISLRSPIERSAAVSRLCARAKKLDGSVLYPFVNHVEAATGASLPLRPPAEIAGMGWDELHQLANDELFTVGAHTRTHPILSRVESTDTLADEIIASRTRISQKLGSPIDFFAYPNGQQDDIDDRVLSSVKAAGFRAAVTTAPGLNRRSADLCSLRRLCIRPEMPASTVAAILDSVR